MFQSQFASFGKIISRRPFTAALVSGLAAMIFASAYLKGREAEIMKVAEPVNVVVASRDLKLGEMLDASVLQIAKVPRRFAQPGAFGNFVEAAGRVAITPLFKGVHITPANARRVQEVNGLSSIIPTGLRAVVVDISAGNAAAKLIRPGDMVDVLATFDLGADSSARRTTISIVENVQVLAVGDKIADAVPVPQGNDQKKNLFGSGSSFALSDSRISVAIAATPSDAQTIAFATESGAIALAVRPFGDDGSRTETKPVTISTITGGHDELMPIKKLYREYKGR